VLGEDPDGSRHDVIPRMIERFAERRLELPVGHNETDRIGAYAQAVFAAQAAADECPGASDALAALRGRAVLYVSSNSPEVDLATLVERRGWDGLFEGVYGHPRNKIGTLTEIVRRHGGDPRVVAVVGDGESDEHAAETVGCPFFRVCGPKALAGIVDRLEAADA